ncbi:MAG: apolipoprotein N-acyltransferase [Woeseiaceae bacterium]|nr:apolipoprotein N-acyltransferase [Woeseiaceae bacterium]
MPRPTSILLLPADRPRLSHFAFFLLGCLTTLAFAPFGLSLLILVVLVPFLYVCFTISPRDAAKHGFWFGFGLFLTGTYWIYISVVIFGQAPVWIALFLMIGLVLIMSVYFWILAWLISRLSHGEPWYLLAVAPAAWVIVEWARGWLFTGFPWMALGYSQVDSALGGWAPVLGVYGVSALIVLSGAAILVAIMTRGRQQIVAMTFVLLPGIAGAILKSVDWTRPAGEPLRATIVQGGVSQDRKWLPEQFQPTLTFYRSETLKVADSDIVLWPEVAIPAVTDRVEGYIQLLESDARANEQTILFGILERVTERGDDKPSVYNAIIGVDGSNRMVYRKRHLVPFGEYFPVPETVREWMRMLSLPHSDLSDGDDEQPLIQMAGGVKLASAICYEDAYAAEQLYALPEAGILINVSNDAWFGDSIAPHQHLQIARMRSLEAGRFTIRATNTGVSAFIGPKGKVQQTGPQFEPVTMTRSVQPMQGSTPYVIVGNWLILIMSWVILGVFWLRSRANL